MARYQGDHATARALLAEALALYRAVGDKRGTAFALNRLGLVAHEEGDLATARALLVEGLTLCKELGHKRGISESLEALARLAGAQRQAGRAAQLGGAAEALRAAIGAPMPPVERVRHERALVAARGQLAAGAWAAAWTAGQVLPPEEAVVLALAVPDGPEAGAATPAPPGTTSASPPYPAGLTAREIEVLRLVAEGLTDPQVAERLFLSPRTVNQHLRSVYNKLGVSSRAAAARFAAEHRLL